MLASIVILAVFFTGASVSPDIPELCDPLPAQAKALNTEILISPAQTRAAYSVLIGDLEFELGVDEDGRIVFVSPTSSKFGTPEGIRVGDSYHRLQKVVATTPDVLSGWAYVVDLPSGWKAAFVQGKTMTEGELRGTTKVTFIFKGQHSCGR